MSVFSKKFERLLQESLTFCALVKHSNEMAEYVSTLNARVTSLESRVTTLEGQVNVLASTTRSLMETVTQLVRGHMTNRKAIEELYNFVANPEQTDDEVPIDSDESQASQDEIAAYKKTLN